MSVHVNYDNLLELLAGVAQNLKGKISSIDLTDQQKAQLVLIDKILKTGDGTKYLSDNGTYKNIPLDKMSNMNDSLKIIYDLLKISYNKGDVWTDGYATMPTNRYEFGCVQYNGKIYCIGGWNGVFLNTMDIYDIASNTWSSGPIMPNARYEFGCVLYNKKIYCIGGYNKTLTTTNKVDVYDISTNTWSSGYVNMPTIRYGFGCINHDNTIYCIGGYNGTILDVIEVYDALTNTWHIGYKNIPIATYDFGCIEYNGNIYCIGGNTSSGYINSVNVYNITSDSWGANYNNMPTPRGVFGCVQYNGNIYCIGGSITNKVFNVVEVYNISSNIWSTNYSNMINPNDGLGVIQYNGKIYCIDNWNKVEVYDIGYTIYDITLPSDIYNKLSLLITNGTGTKLLTDNGTYQEYIPSGYRELTTDELNNAINVIKANIT